MWDSLLDLLQQFDTSAFGDLSELDWTNIATYGALILTAAGIIWTSSKNFLRFLWRKTEGIIGFAVSTLVIVALWYTLLRIHVSISFNLDKEIFDDLLWLSAVLFTPYYLIHYNLLTGFLLTVVRSLELMLDLLVFSWFPQKAEQNRKKWRDRISNVYATWKNNIEDFWQTGFRATSQTPSISSVPVNSEATDSAPTEEITSSNTNQEPA
ncbi:MAG: hypothetical protein QNJ46_11380 [Leptolyngbyaceae cyanobacterium MO_188.B28]|nr:hypothetical protein [Leptolyngbyaceae cyanobacterium MO_188.B28]